MILIPVSTADLVLGANWRERERWAGLASAAVLLGENYELDLESAGLDAGVVELLCGYLDAERAFLDRFWKGLDVGAWVITTRRSRSFRQGAGSQSKARGDLVEQLDAMEESADLRGVADALLGAVVGEDQLSSLGVVIESSEGVTSARVRIEGKREWVEALGGAASAGEIERVFDITANHAKWRDRKVRRLAGLDVEVLEIHPDPAPWSELLVSASLGEDLLA